MNRLPSRFFVHGMFLLVGWVGPVFVPAAAAQSPAPTTTPPAGTATAKPENTTQPPTEQAALDTLHPPINYSPWLFAGLAVIVFALLIYNERSQRRQNAQSAAPADPPPGER
jgi:hypothetical protein